ncbi:MAG: dihydrodipicolinate reductase [Anaerolineae bacterium]|nr:dihydrodipicolinate reductase [Anaerolineae bacterium]
MSDEIRVIQVGLGPIGAAVARHVVQRAGLALVGGVDVDPSKVGRDVGDVIGLGHPLGCPVAGRLSDALARQDAQVVLHTTSSHLDQVAPQIVEILEAGLDVVSTSEELSFPWLAHAEGAAAIDAAARRAGCTVLATGVNPGFLMDSLPLALTAICQDVAHIEVQRVINASTRRGPFQAKIGAGLSVEAFRARMAAGRMGHVGLSESIGMVFDTLGVPLERCTFEVEPVVAARTVRTSFFEVPPGKVIGLQQAARAYSGGEVFMSLTFVAALDAEGEQDTIAITGTPNLEVTLKGTNGDLATVAIVVNAIHRVRQNGPGLVTMRDLPLVTWQR